MMELGQESGVQQTSPTLSVGEMLREARLLQNLEAADVARQLRLGLRQIEALEANDFAALPGNTIVRGFIRNYAKLLQLDPAGFLAAYESSLPAPEAPKISAAAENIDISGRGSRRWLYAGFAVLALVIGAPLLTYVLLNEEVSVPVPASKSVAPIAAMEQAPTSTGEASMAVPLPAVQPVASVPVEGGVASVPADQAAPVPVQEAAPVGDVMIQLAFEEDAWVEIRDRSGQKVLSQIGRKGTSQSVMGNAPFSLVIGNAGKVRVVYKGKLLDLQPHIKVNVARLTLE